MNQQTQTPQTNDLYCCYKVQLDKRLSRGENIQHLVLCLSCDGYNSNCQDYTSFRRFRGEFEK